MVYNPTSIVGESWGIALRSSPALSHIGHFTESACASIIQIPGGIFLPAQRKPAFPGMNGGGVPPAMVSKGRVEKGCFYLPSPPRTAKPWEVMSVSLFGSLKSSLTSIIEVPVIIGRQMVDRSLRSANPRRVDRENRPSPAANFIVRPYFSDLVCSLQANLGINRRTIRHETLHHDETAGVAVKLRVLPPGLVEAIINSVKTIDLWRRGEIVGDSLPFLWDGLAELLLPLDRGVESIAPVRDLLVLVAKVYS